MGYEPGDKVSGFNLPNANGGGELSLDDVMTDVGAVVLFECNHCPYVVGSVKRINKAAALAEKYDCLAINDYFEPSKFVEPSDVSRIVCAVDNHAARKEAISFSHALRSWGIPCFIGANEYWTSQAFVFHPSLDAMYCDLTPWPLVKYPEIVTDKSRDPTNPSCVEQQESEPQLAGVNMITASLIMQLVLRWETLDKRDIDVYGDVEEVHQYLPTEFQTTFGATQTQQLKDHDQIKKPTRQETFYEEADELLST